MVSPATPPPRLDRGARRIVLYGLATVSGVVLLFSYRTSTSSELPGESAPTAAADVGTSVQAVSPAPASSPVPGASPAPARRAAASPSPPSSRTVGNRTGWSGTVLGSAIPVRWGQVQVRATLDQGRIVAVDAVRLPDANSGDQQINARAVPILVRESLAAQSARIDMVSGATLTSTGYTRSLQAALDRVGAS
jgi:uncharacterized protein with FMN-binding domain